MEGEEFTPAPRSGHATLAAALNLTHDHAPRPRRAARRSLGANLGWQAGMEAALHADSRRSINTRRGAAEQTPMVPEHQNRHAVSDSEHPLRAGDGSDIEEDSQEDILGDDFEAAGAGLGTDEEEGQPLHPDEAYQAPQHANPHRMGAERPMLVYSMPVENTRDADGEPWLEYADDRALAAFRVEYLKYAAALRNKMRSRPAAQRRPVKAVIELIKPACNDFLK